MITDTFFALIPCVVVVVSVREKERGRLFLGEISLHRLVDIAIRRIVITDFFPSAKSFGRYSRARAESTDGPNAFLANHRSLVSMDSRLARKNIVFLRRSLLTRGLTSVNDHHFTTVQGGCTPSESTIVIISSTFYYSFRV